MGEGKRVLVAGATGYLGRHTLSVAHERGFRVRALARDAKKLDDLADCIEEVFEGQATQPETLEGMCDDVDIVFSSLGNRTLARRPTCFEVDEQANRNILEVARASGSVKHFVFVSVLRGDAIRTRVPQIEARERVVDDLKRGQLPWTIIRPSGFFNDMSEIFEMARKGRAWLPNAGKVEFNPIHGADLAAVCVDAFGDVDAFGKEIPAGGPDLLTMRRIGELAFEALGREPKISTFPMWTLTAASKVIKPFNVNVASLLAMFTAFAGDDAACDKYGTHHLADFFADLAKKADAGEVAAVR